MINSGMFASSVTRPTGVPTEAWSSIAAPVSPPTTTLFGTRKTSTATAASSAPIVSKR